MDETRINNEDHNRKQSSGKATFGDTSLKMEGLCY